MTAAGRKIAAMNHETVTLAIAHCDTCPPLPDWPDRNLITGQCPCCYRPNGSAWRELQARRLIAAHERG